MSVEGLGVTVHSLFGGKHRGMVGVVSLDIKLSITLIVVTGVCFRRSCSAFCPSTSQVCQVCRGCDVGKGRRSCCRMDNTMTPTVQDRVPNIRSTAQLACVNKSGALFAAPSGRHCSTHCVVVTSDGIFSVFPIPVLSNGPGIILTGP